MGYDCRTISGMKFKLVYLYQTKLSPSRGMPYMYTESRCKGERSKPCAIDDCAVQTILGLE
jgi:hypothetical protein